MTLAAPSPATAAAAASLAPTCETLSDPPPLSLVKQRNQQRPRPRPRSGGGDGAASCTSNARGTCHARAARVFRCPLRRNRASICSKDSPFVSGTCDRRGGGGLRSLLTSTASRDGGSFFRAKAFSTDVVPTTRAHQTVSLRESSQRKLRGDSQTNGDSVSLRNTTDGQGSHLALPSGAPRTAAASLHSHLNIRCSIHIRSWLRIQEVGVTRAVNPLISEPPVSTYPLMSETRL